MWRSRAIPGTVALLFLLCGCVEIEVNTKIKENGGGTQRWRFSGSALLSSELKKQVQSNRFFGKSVIRDLYKEGEYILEADVNFKDVSELRDSDRDIRFSSSGLLVKTHTYTEVWKRSGNASGLLAQHARGLVPVTLRIGIELPGKIVETNADWKEGSFARWTVPVTDLASAKTVVAKSRSLNWFLVIPAVGVVLIAFTGLIIFIYSGSSKKAIPSAPLVACAICGAKVPGGSAFCNFCGNKMSG
jgi:hypothetical protein